MKAIQLRYLPPTNTKGARWKAFAEGGASVTIARDCELDGAVDARNAADALRGKMGWRAVIKGEGVLPNGDYVFTLEADK